MEPRRIMGDAAFQHDLPRGAIRGDDAAIDCGQSEHAEGGIEARRADLRGETTDAHRAGGTGQRAVSLVGVAGQRRRSRSLVNR